MRCFSCHKFSFKAVCDDCHMTLFTPTVSTRHIGSLDVISFFGYKNIEKYILSKFDSSGYRIYRYFAKMHIKPFLQSFEEGIDKRCYLIAVDENVNRGYSHTAVLSHYSATDKIKPLHSTLTASQRVEYAGKSLSFRLSNPRDFKYTGPSEIDAILIDDIITTGLTLHEAHITLKHAGVNVLYALTIANAAI